MVYVPLLDAMKVVPSDALLTQERFEFDAVVVVVVVVEEDVSFLPEMTALLL